MDKTNIIVIGASAGGFDAIQQVVADLPANLDAAVFIVWHMSPHVKGILPHILNRQGKLFAAHAEDDEQIVHSRIYIAPPDHHMIIDGGRIRISHGPKENRFRPAIDPLFRSAAFSYGSRVIGVILTGALDDGAAGLWAIKQCNGTAVVQDPQDAKVPSMPENALQAVAADYVVPLSEMAALLTELSTRNAEQVNVDVTEEEKVKTEIAFALEEGAHERDLFKLGNPTPFTCPECHGVLVGLKEGNRLRFRCHTGHAFSADTLLAGLTENIESTLWTAIRSVQESVMLINHMGDHFAELNQPGLAAMYFHKAREAEGRLKGLRNSVIEHEQLSTDGMAQKAKMAEGPGDV